MDREAWQATVHKVTKSWIQLKLKQLSMHSHKYAYEKKSESESHIWLFVTPWTIQAMEFSRPEYWSGWPFPFPGDLPNIGMEPRFSNPGLPHCGQFTSWATRETQEYWSGYSIPSPKYLDPGIQPGSPALQADSLPTELSSQPNSPSQEVRTVERIFPSPPPYPLIPL